MKVAINFDAVTEVMTELPKPKTTEIELIYKKIKERNPERFANVKSAPVQEIKEDDDDLPF